MIKHNLKLCSWTKLRSFDASYFLPWTKLRSFTNTIIIILKVTHTTT